QCCVQRKLTIILVLLLRRRSQRNNLASQPPRVNAKSNDNQSNHDGRSHEGTPLRAEPPGEPLNEIVGTQRNERGKPGQKIAPDNGGAVIRQQQEICKQSYGRDQQNDRKSVLTPFADHGEGYGDGN